MAICLCDFKLSLEGVKNSFLDFPHGVTGRHAKRTTRHDVDLFAVGKILKAIFYSLLTKRLEHKNVGLRL